MREECQGGDAIVKCKGEILGWRCQGGEVRVEMSGRKREDGDVELEM